MRWAAQDDHRNHASLGKSRVSLISPKYTYKQTRSTNGKVRDAGGIRGGSRVAFSGDIGTTRRGVPVNYLKLCVVFSDIESQKWAKAGKGILFPPLKAAG